MRLLEARRINVLLKSTNPLKISRMRLFLGMETKKWP
jgi:hypothetical protein